MVSGTGRQRKPSRQVQQRTTPPRLTIEQETRFDDETPPSSRRSRRWRLSQVPFYLIIVLLLLRYLSELTGGHRRVQTRRQPLPRETFVHRPLSDEATTEFFLWEPPETLTDIQPLGWTCPRNDTSTGTKLIFLHQSRTAGSMVRALLKGYAHFCHASLALVSHCMDVGLEYLGHDKPKTGEDPIVWTNSPHSRRPHQMCEASFAVDRDDKALISSSSKLDTDFLEKYNFDILGGQIPVGVDVQWRNADRSHVAVQYHVWMRDPITRLLSEFSLQHKTQTLDQLCRYVKDQLRRGFYYEKSAHYLITPAQKYWIHQQRVSWTPQRRVNLTLSNLVQHPVAVGIFEEPLESLRMIHYLLGEEYADVDRLLDYFYESTKNLTATVSRTTPLLEELRRNSTLLALVERYTAFERQIYEYAVRVHRHQAENLPNLRAPTSGGI